MSKFDVPPVIVSERRFHTTAADCFVLFEKYKLKTNVIALNLEKEMVPECC
jgi:hypothetical protein